MVDTLSYRKYSDWSDIYSVYIGKAGLFQRQGDSDNQVNTILWSSLASQSYRTAENYWGRIPRFCGYLRKFSPWNLGNGVLWRGTSEQSTNVFSYPSPIRDFFPSKVSHYTVVFFISDTQPLNLSSTSSIQYFKRCRNTPTLLYSLQTYMHIHGQVCMFLITDET